MAGAEIVNGHAHALGAQRVDVAAGAAAVLDQAALGDFQHQQRLARGRRGDEGTSVRHQILAGQVLRRDVHAHMKARRRVPFAHVALDQAQQMLGQLDDHAFLLGRRDEDVGRTSPVPGRIQRISASTLRSGP